MITRFHPTRRRESIIGLTAATLLAAVSFTAAQPPGEEVPVIKEMEMPTDLFQAMAGKGVNSLARAMPGPLPPAGGEMFKLTVAHEDGTLEFKYNPAGDLEKIFASKGVVLVDTGTTISCDTLVYDLTTSEILASGPGLVVEQGTDSMLTAILTADTYSSTPGEQTLEGNARIENLDRQGRPGSITTGKKIVIRNVKGIPRYKIIAGQVTATP